MSEKIRRIVTLAVAIVTLVSGVFVLYEKLQARMALKLPATPDVFVSGSVGENLFVGLNTSENVYGWAENVDGVIRMEYPGAKDWGTWFITAGESSREKDKRKYMDFSPYSNLLLEVKGKKGTALHVSIKDRDDINDGKEPKYLLKFTSDDWETHTIGLERFQKVNRQELNVVTNFVFGRTPMVLEVRKIQYQ